MAHARLAHGGGGVTATEARLQIDTPGVYDLTAEVYHADPVAGGSLSSSGARKLLPPSCPAIYRYELDHRPPHKRVFDFGHAAHCKVLGIGAEVVPVKADSWRTKAAKEARDAAYAEGKTPLLADEVSQVDAMAAAIREHPIARALFDPERGGKGEQSLFWQQPVPVATPDGPRPRQVWRRAMLDWLPALTPSGRLIIPDYKTTVKADPQAFAKSVFDLGYHQQAPWYTDGALALEMAEDIAFVFVAQQKTPPYPVTVLELDVDAMRIGRLLNQQALQIFAACQETGHWPGFSEQVELVSPPPWVLNQFKDQLP